MGSEEDQRDARAVCFMHIGKVGGHSISLELLNRFNLTDTYNGAPAQFDELAEGALESKRLIIGHYSYRHLVKLPKNRFLFSMVRDPIDRVVSNYFYLKTYPGEPTSTSDDMIRLAKEHDFDSFIRLKNLQVRQVVENHQCNFFADDWRSPVGSHSEEHLEKALSHLDAFDFIGIHEAYDESMQFLAAMLRWLPWPSDNRLNATPSREDVSQFSADTLAYLRELNRLDIRLYAEIEKRYRAKRRDILRTLVRDSSIARSVSEPKAGSSPAMVEIYADRPFVGENWHTRSIVSGGYARWIGPESEASLYVDIDRSRGCLLELFAYGWVSQKALNDVTVLADGVPCRPVDTSISENDGAEHQKAVVRFNLPPSPNPKLELRIVTIPPLPLSQAGYTDSHSRTGSLAIGMVRFTPAAPGKEPPKAATADSAKTADALDAGRQMLMAAQGRLSWIMGAEASFRDAIAAKPDDPLGHYWLGLSICYQGRAPDAVEHFRTALDLHNRAGGLSDDERRQAHERLGEGLMLSERLDEAQAELSKAVKLQSAPEVGQRLNSATYMLDGLERQKRRPSARRLARWPVNTGEFKTLEQVIAHATKGLGGGEPLLRPDTKVATLGSCFAQNIAHALQGLDVQVHSFGMGELINSTYANRALLEWVTGMPPSCAEASVITVLQAYFGESPGETRHRLAESDVVIFTLGVAPGFFDKRTGLFHLTQPGSNTLHLLAEKEFRTTTVAENVKNIGAISALIRKLNPKAQIVFTVSPVPLYSSFEYSSAIVADCVSKSTLRVAIDAYIKSGSTGVHYWPAFEIVRWLGAYYGPMFGAEDGTTRHVSEQVVTAIVQKFVQVHGSSDLAARLTEIRSKK